MLLYKLKPQKMIAIIVAMFAIALFVTFTASCSVTKKDCQGVKHTKLKNGIYLLISHMKYLILVILSAFLLSSCDDVSTVVTKRELPITVSKLAQTNTFDTLTVVKESDNIHIYEQNEYKESIPLKGPDIRAVILLIGVMLGFLVSLILISMFHD